MSDYKLVSVDPTPEMVEAARGSYMRFGYMEQAIRAALLAAPAVQSGTHTPIRPLMKIEHHSPDITIEKDFFGTVHIKLGDFDYIQIQYQYPHTDNARQLRHAMLIADVLTGAAPQPAAHQPYPEAVREGAPYDDPAFESLCREYGIWGTPAAAQCAVFWEAGKRVAEQQPELAKYQPCGCVVCTCEHETQCQGCGAKHCGTHPIGQIPEPVYQQPAPDVEALEPFINKATGEKAMNKPKNRHRNLRSLMREGSADFDPGPARQPAPDVAGLVEALEAVVAYDESVEDTDGNLMMHYADMMKKVRAALAAHRKGAQP